MGKNEKAIKEYLAGQLKREQESDELSIFDPRDPFTDGKQQLQGLQAKITHLCVTGKG